jgi:GTP-binding protein
LSQPIVALVGCPNVGKSALFNRLVGERLAIVQDQPGTTRDRLYVDAEWAGREFTLVDTGGLLVAPTDDLSRQVQAQATLAIHESDVVIFVVDVLAGITPGDWDVADVLRRSAKPVILAVNKADNAERRLAANEFYALGIEPLFAISALHGTGTGDLLDAVVASFPPAPEEEPAERVGIAIVGHPNVGKSSLLNAILGQERVIVSPIPGTTRDAIDTQLVWRGQEVMLIDTAGIRRRGAVAPGIEKYSVLRALRAINRADVALLVIDASQGVTAQDAHIAGYILEESKSVVVVVNKWDLVEKEPGVEAAYRESVRQTLKFLPYVPILFASALKRRGVKEVMDTAVRVREARFHRLSTGELNSLVRDAVAAHAPPSRWGKRLRIYYATQPQVDPPTFVFFVNDVRLLHFSYERYLENRIRERYPFEGTPIRLQFRGHASKA